MVMKSEIKWQTVGPKSVGFYLVSTAKNEVVINHVTMDENGNLVWFAGKDAILAWCKLSDIEPYKE